MNLFNRRPKNLVTTTAVNVEPENMPQPQTAAEYERRGYAFYARSKFKEAEADFQKALEIDPNDVDACYALGMTYKADKMKDEAIQTFQKALQMIDRGLVENKVRADMLRRLANGHINEINNGDWNLEKEIWKKEE